MTAERLHVEDALRALTDLRNGTEALLAIIGDVEDSELDAFFEAEERATELLGRARADGLLAVDGRD